jgi:hypothetical protein
MLANFQAYGSPQTLRGIAAPYGAPSWHISGRVFTIRYRLLDPDEARRQIAPPLGAPDPVCRARFYHIMFDARKGDALSAVNPEQSQFHEAVLDIPCSYQNPSGDYSLPIYSANFAYASA